MRPIHLRQGPWVVRLEALREDDFPYEWRARVVASKSGPVDDAPSVQADRAAEAVSCAVASYKDRCGETPGRGSRGAGSQPPGSPHARPR